MQLQEYHNVLEQFHMSRLPRAVGTPHQHRAYTYRDFFSTILRKQGPIFVGQNSYDEGHIVVEKVFVEYEGEDDLGRPHGEMLKTSKMLQEKKYPHTVLYTSNGSFHLNISCAEERYPLASVSHLSSMYRDVYAWVEDKTGAKTLDLHCAEPARLQRVPFTPHESSNGTAVPVPPHMLEDIGAIMALAKEPKLFPNYIIGKEHPMRPLRELWEHEAKEYRRPPPPPGKQVDFHIPEGKLWTMLDDIIPQKCIVNAIATPNPPHIVRFGFATWLKFHQFTVPAAISLVDRVAEEANWSDRQNTSKRHYMTKDVVTKEYRYPECPKLMEKGLCVGPKCSWFPKSAEGQK